MKKKDFTWMPKSPALRAFMQSPLGILGINWIFQGMRGMQRKELSFRLLLEAVIVVAVFAWLPFSYGIFQRLLIAFVIAHSFNWLFNTHLWVCVRYFPSYRRNPTALTAFLGATERFLQSLPWLNEVVCIGSVGDSGRIRSERSDIDLRIIFPSGAVNWLRVNLVLLRLRICALFKVIPLDLYAYDGINALDRFRQDEHLLLILDRKGVVRGRYPSRVDAVRITGKAAVAYPSEKNSD